MLLKKNIVSTISCRFMFACFFALRPFNRDYQVKFGKIFLHCLGQLLLSWQSASFLLVLKLLIPVLYRFYDFILYCKNSKKIPSKREAKIEMNDNKNKLFCFIIDSKCLNDKMFAYLYKGNYHSEFHKSFKQMQLHVDIRHLLILRA